MSMEIIIIIGFAALGLAMRWEFMRVEDRLRDIRLDLRILKGEDTGLEPYPGPDDP